MTLGLRLKRGLSGYRRRGRTMASSREAGSRGRTPRPPGVHIQHRSPRVLARGTPGCACTVKPELLLGSFYKYTHALIYVISPLKISTYIRLHIFDNDVQISLKVQRKVLPSTSFRGKREKQKTKKQKTSHGKKTGNQDVSTRKRRNRTSNLEFNIQSVRYV